MTAGAPLAKGGTAAGTEDTRGGDIPTTGMDAMGTLLRDGMLAMPPRPRGEKSTGWL